MGHAPTVVAGHQLVRACASRGGYGARVLLVGHGATRKHGDLVPRRVPLPDGASRMAPIGLLDAQGRPVGERLVVQREWQASADAEEGHPFAHPRESVDLVQSAQMGCRQRERLLSVSGS